MTQNATPKSAMLFERYIALRAPLDRDALRDCLVSYLAGGRRWTAQRKIAVLSLVRSGLADRAELCGAYGISDDEMAGWEAAFDRGGAKGLMATRARQRARDDGIIH